jgi:hypothetical protein
MTIADRDRILGITRQVYDVERFQGATGADLLAILEGGMADPDDTQNDAPSYREFVDWLLANPKFRAHGYVVTERRPDCRVSIEGVEGGPVTPKEMAAFVEFSRHADEFEATRKYCRSWWD